MARAKAKVADIQVRLPASIKARIQRMADDEGRSLSAMTARLLERATKDHQDSAQA